MEIAQSILQKTPPADLAKVRRFNVRIRLVRIIASGIL